MQTYVIDFTQILSGASSADRVSQTGISIKSKGISLDYNKGVVHFTPNPSVRNPNVLGRTVATCTGTGLYATDRYLLTDQGRFYSFNGGTLTLKQYDTTNTYQPMKADMLMFLGNFYATSNTNIAFLAGDMTSLDATWWTGTKGKPAMDSVSRHILLVVEDTMYISDNNYIHTWDGTTAVTNVIVIPPGFTITSMIGHSDGRKIIAYAASKVDFSSGSNVTSRRYIIDPFDATWTETELDAQVNGSINVEGNIYVTTVNKLGIDTGVGIQYIRDLAVPRDGWFLPGKHKLFNNRGTLLLAEATKILAYGEVIPGQKVFYYPHRQDVIYNIDTLFVIGNSINDSLYVTCQDNLNGTGNPWSILKIDTASIGYNGVLYLDRIPLPANAWIRRIDIERTQSSVATGSGAYNFGVVRESDGENATQIYPVNGTRKDRLHLNIRSSQPQFFITPLYGQSYGIQKMVIYYELVDE